MKTKLTKIKLLFLSISLIVMSFVTVSAVAPEYHHTHIDHEDSENCIYSCTHSINIHSPTERADHRSTEENERLMSEFSEISSDAEFAEWISEYYEIPFTEADLVQLREYARSVRSNTIDPSVFIELEDNCDEVLTIMTNCENSINADTEISCGNIDLASTDSWGLVSCEHMYLAAECQGNHYGQSDCEVWCVRPEMCMYCHAKAEVTVREEAHTWSVGWCEQTCTVCGKIEMFHEEGGCWFCS